MLGRIATYIAAVCAWVGLTWFVVETFQRGLAASIGFTNAMQTLTAIVVGLFIVCMIAATLFNRRKSSLPATGGGEIDPSKWYFDPETGQYRRILYTNKEGTVLDSRTHDQIRLSRAQARDKIASLNFFLKILTPVFIVSLIFCVVSINDTSKYYLMIPGFPLALFSPIFLIIILVERWQLRSSLNRWDQLPPAPLRPPGREEVEAQKAHGDAKPATLDEIHSALNAGARRSPGAAATPPQGYRFDE